MPESACAETAAAIALGRRANAASGSQIRSPALSHNGPISATDPQHRFDRAASSYDGARPGYPTAAIEWLLARTDVGPGERVIDLGAGTGLLTRALATHGPAVVAAEPNAAMRARLVDRDPEIEVTASGAERIDHESGTFALATAGQAYHWFELGDALPEVRRVLVEGGFFAVVWIKPQLDDPIQRKLEQLAERLRAGARYPGAGPDEPLRWERWFEPVATETFPYEWDFGEASIADYVSSFSSVAILERAERERLLAGAATWAPAGERLELPFYVEIHLGRARP